ncbi:hypothetical protein FIBSPDRAFT_893773 [Athelia psychrophila]|uniref:Uncharacterized protein n=1 Tax=Athelia psychrophila TaxID=1759441 RepID=A0A166GPR5_9AGAM|nr:hypothetical protein FIBSPDRAFT_893773 [Fibularhizoctonia sp. CBS 109695]
MYKRESQTGLPVLMKDAESGPNKHDIKPVRLVWVESTAGDGGGVAAAGIGLELPCSCSCGVRRDSCARHIGVDGGRVGVGGGRVGVGGGVNTLRGRFRFRLVEPPALSGETRLGDRVIWRVPNSNIQAGTLTSMSPAP